MATRVAIVTGANKGIGLAIVRGICKQFNGDVILTSRDPERGATAVKQLEGEGLKVKFHLLDIDSRDSISELKEFVKQTYNGIDVLVNNAAIAFKMASTAPFLEQAKSTINTNFTGTLNVTKALLPLMRPHSRMVMVCSRVGPIGLDLQQKFDSPNLTEDELVALMEQFIQDVTAGNHSDKGWPSTSYRVSMLGKNALTRITSRQVATMNDILVNACCPGWVNTDMAGPKAPLSPDEGAETPIFLTSLPADSLTGKLWYKKEVIPWETPFTYETK